MNNKGEENNVFTTEGHFFQMNINYLNLNLSSNRSLKSKKTKQETNKRSKPQCKLEMHERNYFNLRFNLPMQIKQFDRVFDMVGVDDNIEKLLERKAT